MEHIVQFAISIDDNAITKLVTENAEKEIIKDIKQSVIDKLFDSGWYRGKANPEKDPLSEYAKAIVEDMLEENKDTILEKASKILAEKLVRSKKGKEIFDNLEV